MPMFSISVRVLVVLLLNLTTISYSSKEAGNSPPYGGGTALSFLGQAVNIAPRWDPTTAPYDSAGNYSKAPKGYGANDTWNPLAAAKEPDIINNRVVFPQPDGPTNTKNSLSAISRLIPFTTLLIPS